MTLSLYIDILCRNNQVSDFRTACFMGLLANYLFIYIMIRKRLELCGKVIFRTI